MFLLEHQRNARTVKKKKKIIKACDDLLVIARVQRAAVPLKMFMMVHTDAGKYRESRSGLWSRV